MRTIAYGFARGPDRRRVTTRQDLERRGRWVNICFLSQHQVCLLDYLSMLINRTLKNGTKWSQVYVAIFFMTINWQHKSNSIYHIFDNTFLDLVNIICKRLVIAALGMASNIHAFKTDAMGMHCHCKGQPSLWAILDTSS
jgi:hypothetical protein